MIIYLIGMMGSGKSTFGKQLAAYLNFTFVDLDESIVLHEGLSISQIFEKSGEDGFRIVEQNALKRESVSETNKVIATGGGTPCFFDNMAFMNDSGCTLFLNIPASEIAKRLSIADNSHRPLLQNKSYEEIEMFIKQKLQERILFYEEAEVEIMDPNIDLGWLKGMIM